MWRISRLSLRLELLANGVTDDLVPFDLGARDGQKPAESLESRVRHGLIIFRNGRLIFGFTVLHQTHQFLCRGFVRLEIKTKKLMIQTEGQSNEHMALTVIDMASLTSLEDTSCTFPSS